MFWIALGGEFWCQADGDYESYRLGLKTFLLLLFLLRLLISLCMFALAHMTVFTLQHVGPGVRSSGSGCARCLALCNRLSTKTAEFFICQTIVLRRLFSSNS